MKFWSELQSWFDGLSLRERALILTTVLAFILLPGYVLLIEPAMIEQQGLQMKVERLQSSNREKQQDIRTLEAQDNNSRNDQLASQINQLQSQLTELATQASDSSSQLMNGKQAVDMLQQLLADANSIHLLSLSKATASPFLLKTPEPSKKTKLPPLYQHPLELALKGDTAKLIAFVEAVEALSQPLFIDQVQWIYGKGDQAELNLQLHSLSTSADWLGGVDEH